MKGIAHDVEGLEFSVADGETGRIGLAVLESSDLQSLLASGRRNQLNQRFQRREWFGTPVDGKASKEALLDLVPFAGRRGIMRHADRELFFSSQGLQGFLPQLVTHAIAACSLSADEQFVRLRIQPLAAALAAPPDALSRE